MAFNVNSLSTYVEENKGDLIAKSIFGAVTTDYVTIQTGLKGKTAINILDVDVTFQDGSTCGFNPEGNDTFTQRFINPKHVKVDKEWCDKDLLGKYTQYEVVTAATGKELPFEAEILGQLADGVKAGIEEMIWNGFSGNELTGDAGEGFDHIIASEVNAKITGYDGTNAWAKLNEAYLNVSTEILGKEDLMVYASVGFFESLVLELVNANLYHYNPNDKTGEITMPGTGVKIVRCNGMSGVEAVIARKSNMFYGVDLESDSTNIDVWYSKDNKTFRATVEFVIGMQIAFPNEVVAITA